MTHTAMSSGRFMRSEVRCTKCSQPVRPIVAIDIDGTLGDYHGHLCDFAAGYLGWSPKLQPTPWNGLGSWREWFCNAYHCDVRTFRDIKLAYRQGGQKRTMPVYNWSRYLTANVRAAGAELWLTTTRPYNRLDAVDPDTREWLKRHGIKYDYLLYDDHKYELLAQQVDAERVCAILDDLDEMLTEASRYFDPSACLLAANSWNSSAAANWTAVDSGDAALRAIVDRITQWNATYSS
jgi:hypothetical protein